MAKLKKGAKDPSKFNHPSDAELTQECSCCHRSLKLNQFYFSSDKAPWTSKYGRRTKCISCWAVEDAERYEANMNKFIFEALLWQKKNKKRKNKNNREYYERNKEKVVERVKAYQARKRLESQSIHHSGQHTQSAPPQVQSPEVRADDQPAQK